MALSFFKVTALPETLVANGLYFLQSNVTGQMEIYMANSAGTATRKVTGAAEVQAALDAYDAQGASKLATARAIQISGAATGSVDFDGTQDVNIAVTLANSGVTAGKVSGVTVNEKGLVTAIEALKATDLPAEITSDTTGNAATASVADKVAQKLTINSKDFDGSAALQLNVPELDTNGLIKTENLPSYVDDVLEFADEASLPEEGETGKIYVTLDNGKVFRWSGSTYIRINDAVSSAEQAGKLATARTIALTGDATGSASFDGSENKDIAVTLANTGVVAGEYGVVTVDAKGRATQGRSLELSDLPAGITATGVDFAQAPAW